jgi:hypothetical protein
MSPSFAHSNFNLNLQSRFVSTCLRPGRLRTRPAFCHSQGHTMNPLQDHYGIGITENMKTKWIIPLIESLNRQFRICNLSDLISQENISDTNKIFWLPYSIVCYLFIDIISKSKGARLIPDFTHPGSSQLLLLRRSSVVGRLSSVVCRRPHFKRVSAETRISPKSANLRTSTTRIAGKQKPTSRRKQNDEKTEKSQHESVLI